MKHFNLITYYMDIFGIERGPEFYSPTDYGGSPVDGFSVLMPINREIEKRFTAFIKMLGYEVVEESYWENHGYTNSPSHIHKFACGYGENYVLSVVFKSI